MSNQFFEQPILNSPYAYPGRHWELDADGQPTNIITESRRKSAFITPVPKPKKRRRGDGQKQVDLMFAEPEGISTSEQQYDPKQCEWLAAQTGAKIAVIGTMAHAFPDTETFIKFSEHNVNALLEAVK